ncbi:MAG: hypothetical protein Q4E32_06260 [Bacteroidales bacterium]|nr:hypothetical protein [Bacteroidales bacterium]
MRTKAFISFLCILLAVLTGCRERARVSARLDALDTLLSLPSSIAEPPADFDSILTQLDTLMYDVVGDDALEARWNLLYAMSEDKADRPLLFDTHVRPAYDYYHDATHDGTRGDSTLLHRFAQSCFYMGVYYYHSESTALLEQMMQKSADVAKSCNDHYTAYLALTYLSGQLAWSNYREASGMAEAALEEYRMSAHQSPYNEISILLNICDCYLNGLEWKKALPFLEQTRKCSVSQMDSLYYGNVLYYMAIYYLKAQDFTKSLALLNECLPRLSGTLENQLYIAEIYAANDSLEQARTFLLSALESGAKERAIIFSRLQRIALLQHDEASAVTYGDSVLRAFQMKYWNAVHQDYEENLRLLEVERENMQREHKLFRERVLFTSVAVVFLLLLITAVVVIHQRHKRGEQALLFNAERMARQLQEKDRVIGLLRRHLTEKSNVIEAFRSIGRDGAEAFRLTSDDWLYLEKTLDELDDNFVCSLRMHDPKIDDEIIRLAMLIRIGLNNRQMAEVFNLTLEAIKKRKQKLRKYVDVTPLQKDI